MLDITEGHVQVGLTAWRSIKTISLRSPPPSFPAKIHMTFSAVRTAECPLREPALPDGYSCVQENAAGRSIYQRSERTLFPESAPP